MNIYLVDKISYEYLLKCQMNFCLVDKISDEYLLGGQNIRRIFSWRTRYTMNICLLLPSSIELNIGSKKQPGGNFWVQLAMESSTMSDQIENSPKEVSKNIWVRSLRRSVRSCSHTIPKKVRISRPINMGFKGWE